MPGSVIDGEDWINKRLKFLRERLADDLADGERRAVEAEIETLSKERHQAGPVLGATGPPA